MTISVNGDIRACSQSHIIEGNIFDDNLSNVWNKMSYWRDESLLPENCKSCGASKSCSGGCRMTSLNTTGSLDGNDPMSTENFFIDEVKSGNTSMPISLNDTDKLFLNPSLRFRQESEENYLCYLGLKSIFLSEGGINLFRLISEKEITYLDLIEIYKQNPSSIVNLVSSGFLIRKEI